MADDADVIAALTSVATTPTPSPANNTAQHASYGLVGLTIFVVVMVVLFLVRRRCHHDDVESGSDEECAAGVGTPMTRKTSLTSLESSPSYWTKMDLQLRQVLGGKLLDYRRLEFADVIGRGQFGCVYKASLVVRDSSVSSDDQGPPKSRPVAVKTLKGSDFELERIEAFLREGMLMREFDHENVLTLIGVAFGDHSLPMIVLPYMTHGNLKKYVSRPQLAITVRELLGFALQIARGMHYLATHKFVHRDIAARNCMLDDHLVVKVADFGLSRDIYHKDYYSSKDGQALLPVKWMALESLANSIYTIKTDVWAYGVLLWELLTRGATPYPDVSNWDVRHYIEDGRRMSKPQSCPDEVYELMTQCWATDSIERPLFCHIVTRLAHFLRPDEETRLEDDDDDDDDDHPRSPHDYINLATQVVAFTTSTTEVV